MACAGARRAAGREVAAAVNLWHFQAKMEARGARELVDVVTAARDLGLDPDTPLLGYVLRDTGDRFFAACLAQETASVQKAVRDELLNDLGYGDTPITADEIRDLYPRTFPRPFGP